MTLDSAIAHHTHFSYIVNAVSIVCWQNSYTHTHTHYLQYKQGNSLNRRKRVSDKNNKNGVPSEINYIDQLICWQPGRHKLIWKLFLRADFLLRIYFYIIYSDFFSLLQFDSPWLPYFMLTLSMFFFQCTVLVAFQRFHTSAEVFFCGFRIAFSLLFLFDLIHRSWQFPHAIFLEHRNY